MKKISAFAGMLAVALFASAPVGIAQDELPPPPPEGAEQAPPPPGAPDPAAGPGAQPSSAAAPAASGSAAVSQAPDRRRVMENGGPRGGGDRMEQFRQRMNDYLKTALKVSDEEWAVILPLLEKVQNKQRESMGGRLSMAGIRRGGQGGQGGPGGAAARPFGRSSSPEADALKAALENEAAAPADIKAKLEALRESRKKSAAELEQAREELRKVLTQRQEATLVLSGILD